MFLGFVLFAVFAVSPSAAASVELSTEARVAANPIRKVVTMLQMTKEKVEEEGKKEQASFDKFMCYCQTSGGDLDKGIDAAKGKIEELESSIEAAVSKKEQVKKDLEEHNDDRASAKKALADATGVRTEQNAAFVKLSTDLNANIDSTAKAIVALEKGMGAAFLQSRSASILKALVGARESMVETDRQEMFSFLSGSQNSAYAPASGEIVGILKTMHDEMTADLKDATAAENKGVKNYEGLVTAKKSELATLQKMIEEKLGREADLGVKIAQLKNDLDDTTASLAEDEKFVRDLAKNCASKSKEWEEVKKVRAEELLALADTIKLLNDDDALELFKKTLPSASASFLQVQVGASSSKARALAMLNTVHGVAEKHPQFDFILLALRGQKIGFEKVLKMIDELVATLAAEQKEDEEKQIYCSDEFDASDDKKKSLERTAADLETVIAETKESIETTVAEIAAVQQSIVSLDKSVVEATALRKQEHSDFKELVASDTAAKEVLLFAKNRLNKFYNPKLYKAPAKRDLSEEDRITVNMGGSLAPTAAPGGIGGTGITALFQVRARSQHQDAPPPPPEAFGAYSKKSGSSNGVMAMMDLLVKDLDKELTEGKTVEADAQADYEDAMKNAAEKRTQDAKSLSDKQGSVADMRAALNEHQSDKSSTAKELATTLQYINALHNDCDWLIKYFDVRKDARSSESDALGKAKAVLSGADYSLLQVGQHHF